MKQFWIFIKKEFLHVFRDKKTLLMLFGLPIVQIVLFGFALTNEIQHAKIAIYDDAKDAASQHIIGKLEASEQFQVERSLVDHQQIEAVFKEGEDRKSTRLNSSHVRISYAVFC